MMNVFLKICLTSLLSLAVLFVLTKLIGNKQVSEANMFDYINGITIGSIAAELATSIEKDFMKPLIAMVIYGVAVIIINCLTQNSLPLRRFFNGKEIILFDEGKIFPKNLKKARIDVNEFLCQCRLNGFFDLSDIQSAVFETNGKISFLPTSESRPFTPRDNNYIPPKAKIYTDLIIDGKVITGNLFAVGYDENRLKNEMNKQGIKDYKDVFLAVSDGGNSVTFYKNAVSKSKNTPFQ